MEIANLKNLPIGVFDSGVGGLTVAREIMRQIPNERIVYFGDTARVPYGSKSKETVTKYSRQIVRFLETQNVKAIVIACNTASAYALEQIEKEIKVPIIGVVKPGAVTAARATQNGKVGVIATEGTIQSEIYTQYIKELKQDAKVIGKACPLFVPLVENGFVDADDPIPRLTAERYLAPIKESGADTLILGCTHYPLLSAVISAVLPDVTLIDTGYEAAQSLAKLLSEREMQTPSASPGTSRFYVSDEPQGFAHAASRFLGLSENEPLPTVERVNIAAY